MATRMQQRRGTATQWTTANPILAAGEIGFETDTGQFKIGDGVNQWSNLSYFKNLEDLDGDGFLLAADKAVANGVASLDSDGLIPNNQIPSMYINSLINTRVADVIGAAPGALDTLNELAAAIGNDPDFINTLTDAIALKAPSASPTFTGTVTLPESGFVNIGSDSLATVLLAKANVVDVDAQGVLITNLQGSVDTLFTNVGTAESDINTLESRADVIENNITVIQSDITSIESDIDSLNTSVAGNATGITGLEGELENVQTNLQGQITTNAGNITTLQSGLSTLESEVDGIDTRLFAAESDIDSLQTSATTATGHASATTNVHGIADTAALATTSYVDNAIGNTENYVDTQLALKADLTSPALTGTPTAPTATLGTDTTQIATTAFVQDAIEAVIGAAPAALDTLNELAAAINDDASYAATVTSALALKAPLASPSFTGTVALPAASSVTLDGTALSTTLEAKSDKNATINVMSGSHTIVLADVYNVREMSNGGTISIPADNSFWPVGATVDVIQTGSSQVTIAGGSGVTVNATPGLKLRAQWSGATILKRSANTFVVLGDLSA